MSESNEVQIKFSSQTKDGETINFRIVEMPDDKFEEVADLIRKYFVTEEALFKASGVPESKEAMEEIELYLQWLQHSETVKISVCSVDDGTEQVNDIVGASIMNLMAKDDSPENFTSNTTIMKRFLEIIFDFAKKIDPMKTYGLDRFYDDRGVVVHPKYRRLGITGQFFKNRRLLCKEEGVPMTGAWMTSIGSQKAAAKDGWETVYEESYEDLGKQYGLIFENCPPTCKYMIGRAM